MDTYSISLIIDREPTDHVLDLVFAELPDAVLSSVDGLSKLTSQVSASDEVAAALALIEQVRALGVGVRRVDQDLVAIADIAERTGRSRESVRLLVDGRRGPGEFPAAIGVVGKGIRVWPWSIVLVWFRDSLHDDHGELAISPEASALVDALLAGRLSGSVKKLGTLKVAAGSRRSEAQETVRRPPRESFAV